MKTIHITRLCATMLPLLAGCATQRIVVSPVGPEPAHHGAVPAQSGYLRVFSDTEECVVGDGPHYYPHEPYNVYDESGKHVEYVANHIGNVDEMPTLVQITTGHYDVVAESSAYGRVTVPVVIQPGKTTVVHLDRGWRPASNITTNEVVRLPDGDAVGWSSVSQLSHVK